MTHAIERFLPGRATPTRWRLWGARATGTRTITSTLLGRLREDPADRADFLALTRRTR